MSFRRCSFRIRRGYSLILGVAGEGSAGVFLETALQRRMVKRREFCMNRRRPFNDGLRHGMFRFSRGRSMLALVKCTPGRTRGVRLCGS